MRGRVLLALALLLAPPIAGSAQAGDPSSERLLVSLDTWPMPSVTERLLAEQDVAILDRFDAARTLLVQAPPGSGAAIERVPGVAHVTPDEPLDANLDSSKAAVRLTPEMRSAGLNGAGANIALIDSGVDTDHPGLEDRVVAQYAVSEDGTEQDRSGASKHGTHVAGILAGTGDGASPDRGDAAGMAPGSGLVSMDISRQFTTSNALRAFEWIYEHHDEEDIRVVANAWGRQRDPATYEPDDPLIRASDALVDEDLVVVFSAGNGGPDESHMTLEGTNPNVITVGASDDDGQIEDYSSRGPVYEDGEPVSWTKPDLIAPGTRIVSTRVDPGTSSPYVMMNGTSMAAPHVAGAAALLVGLRPDLTPSQVKGLLLESAVDTGPSGVDDASGHGVLDVSAAVELVERAGAETHERSETTTESGELTGPKEAGVALKTASIDHEDTFPVTIPDNATELAGTLRWDGRSELEVSLKDPDGRRVRTVVFSGEHTLEVADPKPGRWTVEVEPAGVARGSYQAEFTVTWLTHEDGIEIPIAEQRTRSGSFPATGGGLDPFAESWLPGVPNLVPMIAGGALTAFMVAGKLRGGSKDEREPGPPPPEQRLDV